MYKDSRIKHSYTLVQSDVNIHEAGVYSVQIMSVDASYNISKIGFKVKVSNEGEVVEEGKKAVGSEGTTLGNAINDDIVDEQVTVEKEETTACELTS